MDTFRKYLYDRVLDRLDLSEEISDERLYACIDEVILKECREKSLPLSVKKKYRSLLFAAFRQLDVLSLALEDEEITEIMVNGPDRIFVERHGKIEDFPESFTTEEKLEDVVQTIASAINRRVNEASPMVDARLTDGSRVNIVLPPVALDGPSVTIRKFQKQAVSMEQLVEWGSLTTEAADFLKILVAAGYNIVVSGGTGSGKTTFLGALAEFIPEGQRVVTIEDSAELKLKNVRNLVRLESRPANLEGNYEITIRSLVRNALRMRPDRIIVGEVRGEEALDLLQALNTGHDGSFSTGHANSASDMLKRLETMCLMGNVELPLAAIRGQIASGVDILVHLQRLRDRSRRVQGIYEVTGMKEGEIEIRPLFVFREEGFEDNRVIGSLKKTEHRLQRTEKLVAGGYRL